MCMQENHGFQKRLEIQWEFFEFKTRLDKILINEAQNYNRAMLVMETMPRHSHIVRIR